MKNEITQPERADIVASIIETWGKLDIIGDINQMLRDEISENNYRCVAFARFLKEMDAYFGTAITDCRNAMGYARQLLNLPPDARFGIDEDTGRFIATVGELEVLALDIGRETESARPAGTGSSAIQNDMFGSEYSSDQGGQANA